MSSEPKSSKGGGWKAAIFMICLEVAERFSYYGVAGNLINYLTDVLHQPTAVAAKNVNVWIGVSSIFPLLGGLVADSYMGRCKTIYVSSIVYLIGLVALTITVSTVPSSAREAIFLTSLYIMSVGEGGHKPCVQTFAADQFDDEVAEEKEAKSSFFNWWYLGIVSGATAAILVVIYVQEYVGWGIGYGMLAGVLAIALGMFSIGSWTGNYRLQAPIGSPFTRVAQVFVAAARKRRLCDQRVDDDGHSGGFFGHENKVRCRNNGTDEVDGFRVRALARTPQYRFLDKAAIIDSIDASSEKRNPWRLCSMNQVEEVKLLLRLIPIWAQCFIFTMVTAQLSTYFTKQGSTMVRAFGPTSKFRIPAASLQVVTGLTILISVPIYERAFIPLARKFTGQASGITMLQRIGTGLFLSSIAMVVAGLVEAKRVETARENGLTDSPKSMVPMKIWWLIPQYMLFGVCDMFTIVGMQELFYDQMPEEMRSMGAAAYVSSIGVGNFMSSLAITAVQGISGKKWLVDNLNRANLHYFYWILAGLSAVNFCVYLFVTKGFIYKRFEYSESGNEKEMGMQVHPEGNV
ncbi:protein NRT1/ PTR FAMILY 5.4 [Coffea eugenioides]|uniref:Protein NRT1/ PTR FAMILY 5.4 isoform X1 n=2 Tax=Coffea arabica TaxID=13443 RepID=A0A6P6UL65_COFAR|nr:protein NRT1/ PTR FAMILY 5.4 [Coffea eugenioides]